MSLTRHWRLYRAVSRLGGATPVIVVRAAMLRLEDRQWIELLAEDGFARRVEPVLKDSGVDAAEIGVELQVALIEVRQRGVIAQHAGVNAFAEEEHGGG